MILSSIQVLGQPLADGSRFQLVPVIAILHAIAGRLAA